MKLTGKPGLVSLAGGLPSADTFPVDAIRDASVRVLNQEARTTLQYARTEGFLPLREWVVQQMEAHGVHVDPAQVVITSGSQQGLDLVAKILLEEGSAVAVESPTYLGALQAFAPYEAEAVSVDCDEQGPLPDAFGKVRNARFLYLIPNFQNPSGRCIGDLRRDAIAREAASIGLPIVEDDPYGDLWFDSPPPPPVFVRWPEGTIYLGSFSKILAPGLRLGFLISPERVLEKLVHAKQAADLHTSSYIQSIVFDVLKTGMLSEHLAAVRARYRIQRNAMREALEAYLPPGCKWVTPEGGMFFWIELPEYLDATVLFPLAVERGVSFVPGMSFYASEGKRNTMRLSFVTESPENIRNGIATLGALISEFSIDR